jgi:hypothetical protein
MAANLSGMFAQMNNAIQQAPTGGGLLDIASQNLGGLAADQMGVANRFKFMNEGGQARELQRQVGGMDLGTAEGLASAATAYGQAGQQENQLKLAQAAAAKRQEQMLRETLVARARKLGMDGVADSLISGGDMESARAAILDMEKTDLISMKGSAARKGLAQAAGIPEAEFDSLGLASVDPETFKQVIEGQKGDVKNYTKDGKLVSLRTSGYGRVWDESQKKFVNPSELGLAPAPNIQRITNTSAKFVEEFQKAGVENFVELHGKANESVQMLNNLNETEKLLENAIVGPGADVNLFVRRLAMALGGDPDVAVSDTEAYLASSGKRVAQQIQAFGAGTGLSDADREFARQIVGGEKMVTPAAMKELLRLQRVGAEGTLELYDRVRTGVSKSLPADEQDKMELFQIEKVKPAETNNARVWVPGKGFQ